MVLEPAWLYTRREHRRLPRLVSGRQTSHDDQHSVIGGLRYCYEIREEWPHLLLRVCDSRLDGFDHSVKGILLIRDR